MGSDEKLTTVVGEWNRSVPPAEISALADAARQRHGGVAVVLFYGSCMRCNRFDEGIVDLYLLVDEYRRAFSSRTRALLNRLLPPNVFYLEVPYQGTTLRAKYAVLTLDDFDRGARRWFHSYIWGRFCQPSGLVYTRDEESATRVLEAQGQAIRSFLRRALPLVPECFTIRDLWIRGLSQSYRCELRSENPAATARLYDAAPRYYEAVTHAALDSSGQPLEALPGDAVPCRYRLSISPWQRKRTALAWRLRQVQGKLLSILRLLKGLMTFENGVEYILWKIERHSGIRMEEHPSLRRFPLLSLCFTFWKLFRRGAFR